MSEQLKDKVAIVTGSGRGLGREIALAYAEKGADLVLSARTVPDIEAVADDIRTLNRRVLTIPADVRREDEVSHMIQRTVEEFGKVDILVNAAGGSFKTLYSNLWEQSVENWKLLLDINLTGVFICIKMVVPQMIKQGYGSIVNISSWVGQPNSRATGFAGYSIAKFGIEGITNLAAAELEEYNLRVNALWPGGPVATSALLDAAELTEERIKILNNLRYGPVVRPDIVRPLAVFLASDDSTGVNGKSLQCKTWNQEHGFGDESQYYWRPEKSS